LDGSNMRIQKAEIRRRIIDAAYGCFWRSGFRRTSVDKIAEQAGVTKRTIYSYFRSKDDLLATVLLRYGGLAAERLQHIGDRMPADRNGRMGEHDATLVGIGFHPTGRRTCGPTRPSGSRHRATRQSCDGIMARRAAHNCARTIPARARARNNVVDGRLDGVDAHSRW
jgi:AcrR family transcriptional regulator